MVADLEELENVGLPEIHARRLNAKEVITPESGEKLKIPVADGKIKLFGRHQVLRTYTLIQNFPEGAPGNQSQEHPERGEVREDFRG